ncbi:kynureninase-like [Hydractinia symbiolongicarpus]|uniref:kynureninase-like n=1 Tax=Hydractinia symbiolongicarpus TaxID=13093 RepID=UPI00254BADDC|nr:kynureninase-like [Hydractinia symbiolongicarpus]
MAAQYAQHPFDTLRKLSLETGLLIETRQFAEYLDNIDELKNYRRDFHYPKNKTISDVDLSLVAGEDDCIYLAGMSLGLAPKQAKNLLDEEVHKWQLCGVQGHYTGKRPYQHIAEFVIDQSAKLIGAKPIEVVIMNTLSVNLHFMMAAFYDPTESRHKILIESNAFPSDHAAVESQIKFHGFDPKNSLILAKPREGEVLLRNEDIISLIEEEGDEIALILFSGVQFYTGQYFDLQSITKAGHNKGCKVGFDLAHAVGNVELKMHEWDVDFACWCTYKYLNSGPGSTAGAFVHEKYAYDKNIKKLTGWWGVEFKDRFHMDNEKLPIIPGARGYAVSNPALFSTIPVLASLDIFEKVGMSKIIKKQRLLTGYLEYLIKCTLTSQLPSHMTHFGAKVDIITPSDVRCRGSQLSLHFSMSIDIVHKELTRRGVVCDKRQPNVIRVSPAPLYNNFTDVFKFVETLSQVLLALKH